jgi:hypothetical protein
MDLIEFRRKLGEGTDEEIVKAVCADPRSSEELDLGPGQTTARYRTLRACRNPIMGSGII